jgi:glycosyltransferase involved in cell wall biosynthesis
MKILHINTERTWRGGEQQTLYLAAALKDRGIESHVVCQPGCQLAERAREARLQVFDVPMRGEADLGAAIRIRGLIRRHGYALLHAHTSHAHTLAYWASAGLSLCRLVTRRVDYSIYRHSFLGWSGIKYRSMADHIIAISKKIRRVLIDDGVDAERISVVPSGVDPARFEGVRAETVAAEFDLRPQERVVINVGQLVGIKGQHTIVQAIPRVLSKVPQARFFIIGGGPLAEDLARQAQGLGLGDRLVLTGFRPDVGAFYRLADLFVMSSTNEGLGTAVLDAMAMGIPVVATEAGGIPEIVADGVTGKLVPPADAPALAARIIDLLADPDWARRLGDAGRQRVLQEFSVTTMVDRTLAIYERLVGEGGRI